MKNILKIIKNNNVNFKRSYHYDVCIVGGGPVGFGLASLLGVDSNLKSKKILLLEAQKQKSYSEKNEFSNRTVALSPQTRAILEKCGAWEVLTKHRINSVKKMFVWEQSSESFITFEKNISSDLAYIVETDLLQHAITSTLTRFPNVEVKYNANVTDIDIKTNEVKVKLSEGSDISVSLLVGADGYQSKVRKLANIDSIVRTYNQKAIVCVVKFPPESPNLGVAWQRFTKHGPIAYLPLDDLHCNLIWSTTGDNADKLMAMGEDEFVVELNKEMFTNEYRNEPLEKIERFMNTILSKIPAPIVDDNDYWKHKQLPPTASGINPNSRATFPLGFMHATNYVSRNVVLVGDSAHRILPLAGQGVNLGFGDVDYLSRCLSEGVLLGETINNYQRLQKYETDRQRYVVPVAATVQSLHELYITDFLPLVMGRAVGLKIVNSIKPLKDFFLAGATKGTLSFADCCKK